MRFNPFSGNKQGVGSGSLWVSGSFLVSGVLTYVFQSFAARSLGLSGYGDFAVLWSAVFLVVQVVWISSSQTLGRHISEREARGEGWRSVARSVARLQAVMVAALILLGAVLAPILTDSLFGGGWLLYAALGVAVIAYAPEYFMRGAFSGRREFSRLGMMHVVEAASRAALAVALISLGLGVFGAALAIVLAPVVAVAFAWRFAGSGVVPDSPETSSFDTLRAARFAGPIVLSLAFAQAFMNGGPALLRALGGTSEEAGLFLAALILVRVPQYVLSPAISALLPHASRTLSESGAPGLDRFIGVGAALALALGAAMVLAAAFFGEWGMLLFYGAGFDAGGAVLAVLAALAAFYLLAEVVSQGLYALGRPRLAAAGWACGVPVAAVVLLVAGGGISSVSAALASGVGAAAVSICVLYLLARRSSTLL